MAAVYKIIGFGSIVVMLMAFATGTGSPTQVSTTLGEYVFNSQCSMCHKIDDKLIGPPLGFIHKRRSYQWFANYTRNAVAMKMLGDKTGNCLSQKYLGAMPPQAVNDRQMQSLWEYIKLKSNKPVPDEGNCAQK